MMYLSKNIPEKKMVFEQLIPPVGQSEAPTKNFYKENGLFPILWNGYGDEFRVYTFKLVRWKLSSQSIYSKKKYLSVKLNVTLYYTKIKTLV